MLPAWARNDLQGCSGEVFAKGERVHPTGDAVSAHRITGSDQESMEKQLENPGQVQDPFQGTSTPFT
jgi:hypothetical protein